MTYVSLDKTWNVISFVVDSLEVTVEADRNKKAFFLLKEALITAGWVVAQSSDGSTTPIVPGTDYWTDYTKLVYATAGTAHSWIVLKNTYIGDDFSVCFDCNFSNTASNYSKITVTVAYGGYQAGTIQNRPVVNTNVLEHNFGSIDFSFYNGNPYDNHGFVVLYSSDHTCFRIFNSHAYTGYNIDQSGYAGCVMLFEKLKNPVNWIDYNYIVSINTHTTSGGYGFSYANFCNTTSTRIRTEKDNMPITLGIATLGVGTDGALGYSTVGKNFSNYDGYYMLTECYAASTTTAFPGIVGQFYDMYFAPINIPEGTYFPTTTFTKGLVKVGQGAFGCSGKAVSVP